MGRRADPPGVIRGGFATGRSTRVWQRAGPYTGVEPVVSRACPRVCSLLPLLPPLLEEPQVRSIHSHQVVLWASPGGLMGGIQP